MSEISEGHYQLQEMMIQEHAEQLKEEMRERDLVDRVWTTKAGQRLPVAQMKTTHLDNCLTWLARNNYHPPLGERWAAVFREELRRREELARTPPPTELCKSCPFGTFETLSPDHVPF